MEGPQEMSLKLARRSEESLKLTKTPSRYLPTLQGLTAATCLAAAAEQNPSAGA